MPGNNWRHNQIRCHGCGALVEMGGVRSTRGALLCRACQDDARDAGRDHRVSSIGDKIATYRLGTKPPATGIRAQEQFARLYGRGQTMPPVPVPVTDTRGRYHRCIYKVAGGYKVVVRQEYFGYTKTLQDAVRLRDDTRRQLGMRAVPDGE